MSYRVLQSSTEYALLFFLVQSADHLTALTGASPTVTISKAGGAFASPSGSVSEIANGWYKVAANATDTNTLGPIALHATATSGDPFDGIVGEVVAAGSDPQVAVIPANVTQMGGSALSTSSAQIGVNVVSQANIDFGALQKTSLNAATPTVTAGTVSDKTGYALTAGEHTNIQTDAYNALNTAFTDATSLNANSLLDRIRTYGWILRNKIAVTDANGNTIIYKDDSSTTAFSVSAMLTDDSTTTTRLRAA